jgi:Fe-S cluster assembly protein SufD
MSIAALVLEKPLYVRIANTHEAGALFWRLLVVAEPESRFSVVEEFVSQSPELSGYSNAVSELFVGDGAKVEYVSLQNLSLQTWHFAAHRAQVDRDAELDWVAGGFGSKKGKDADPERPRRLRRDLPRHRRPTSPTASSTSITTPSRSTSPRTRPRTSPSRGAARSRDRGLARDDQGLRRTLRRRMPTRKNRNLILSEQAHADSIPGLEIEANDVRCTHGATISPVNRDELLLRDGSAGSPEARRSA